MASVRETVLLCETEFWPIILLFCLNKKPSKLLVLMKAGRDCAEILPSLERPVGLTSLEMQVLGVESVPFYNQILLRMCYNFWEFVISHEMDKNQTMICRLLCICRAISVLPHFVNYHKHQNIGNLAHKNENNYASRISCSPLICFFGRSQWL